MTDEYPNDILPLDPLEERRLLRLAITSLEGAEVSDQPWLQKQIQELKDKLAALSPKIVH